MEFIVIRGNRLGHLDARGKWTTMKKRGIGLRSFQLEGTSPGAVTLEVTMRSGAQGWEHLIRQKLQLT